MGGGNAGGSVGAGWRVDKEERNIGKTYSIINKICLKKKIVTK